MPLSVASAGKALSARHAATSAFVGPPLQADLPDLRERRSHIFGRQEALLFPGRVILPVFLCPRMLDACPLRQHAQARRATARRLLLVVRRKVEFGPTYLELARRLVHCTLPGQDAQRTMTILLPVSLRSRPVGLRMRSADARALALQSQTPGQSTRWQVELVMRRRRYPFAVRRTGAPDPSHKAAPQASRDSPRHRRYPSDPWQSCPYRAPSGR